jgi:DNA-binding MarR family transcriptional regulator
VVRQVAPDDRRKILLSLTEKGEQIVERLAPPHHRELSRLCPEMIRTLERICAEPVGRIADC